jgi:hypothetical protein
MGENKPATTPAAKTGQAVTPAVSDDTGVLPVGAHDPINPDGEPRTERPGEILGSAPETPEHIVEGQQINADRADLVTKAVDNANRYALPKLGGNEADNWEADKQTLEDAKKTPADNAKAAEK